MTMLTTKPNLAGHDDLYELLVDIHDGLSVEESLKVNAKLILILANHIGDPNVVREAIEIVRKDCNEKQ